MNQEKEYGSDGVTVVSYLYTMLISDFNSRKKRRGSEYSLWLMLNANMR